ncbi:isoaspartyl peptidase/L-asparaginase isoform X2 [Bemisia tabaci]|nr:PREDICTED: isoaspartyl peptidase/L-asparaginase isoform X2 [Bemisia tabaci]
MHRNLKVCSDHFDEKYFRRDSNRVRLSLEAVPSFNKKPENLSTEHFTDKTKDPCDYYISEDGSELIDTSNNCHYQLPINASIEDLGLKPVVSSNRKSRKSKKSSPSNHSEEFPDDAEVVYLTPKDLEDLNMIEPIIVVHGGAGNYTYADISRCLRGVRAAAIKGHQVVQSGGSILDATVAAVEVMEADPEFNAGKGSVLTVDGKVQMEALVMEGEHMKVGSVTGITNVAHPISVAKLVMDLPHSILGFESATAFAHQNGIPFVPDEELITPASLQALENFKNKKISSAATEIPGTVGAIGIDSNGHMVSCTSTGGMNGKLTGRVGDTPIPGSGGYCDDNIGTVSATGNGESILRYNVSQRILAYLEAGTGAQEATRLAVEGMTKRVGGEAGAITIAKNGDVGIAFTSKRMSWAYVKGSKLYYGINPNEILEENL